MRTAKWIAAWLVLSGIAGLLHMAGEAGVAQVQALPFYVPLVIGALGQMCFYRALRSAIGEAWSGLWGGGRKAQPDGPGGRSGSGLAGSDDPAPTSDFDADAAFARYMARRTADDQPAPQPAARPAPRGPRAPTPAPRAQGGFGRKVV